MSSSDSKNQEKGSAIAGPFSFGADAGSGAGSRAGATGGVRFAPSPTGRFHVGNLRTAWVSWRLARELGLPWVVRFEDIDEPRVLPGALEAQIEDLRALSLEPDVQLVQSKFRPRHLEMFALARSTRSVYACTCSRREVQQALSGLASAPHDGKAPVYSGHCRAHAASYPEDAESVHPHLPPPLESTNRRADAPAGVAWRFKMPDPCGHQDFIIARTTDLAGEKGFVPAYHWACAIDDFDGAYEWIVRSSDLATAFPVQRAIQKWMAASTGAALPKIRAFHTALVTQDDGHRLEKRTRGVTLDELTQQGLTPAMLLELFEQSFAMPRDLAADVSDESRSTLTLRELFGELRRG